MEAAANALLGFLVILCMATAVGGLSLWFQAIVWVMTFCYLIYWIKESLK